MSAQMTESSEEEGLPAKYIKIPLDALNPGTRKKLSLYLNLEGTLNDDVQCENNYRGLAELAGFSYLEIKNFEMKKSPTEEMLDDWTVRNELSPTMGQLWSFLSLLGRDDVLTDCRSYICKYSSTIPSCWREELYKGKKVIPATSVPHNWEVSGWLRG